MRHRSNISAWLLILVLALSGSSAVSVIPRVSHADVIPMPTDPPLPPPVPGAGDPDIPTGPGRGMPKPGPGRGSAGQVTPESRGNRAGSSSWMWKLRTVFAALYRTFFRF